jgi:hypothetical protein
MRLPFAATKAILASCRIVYGFVDVKPVRFADATIEVCLLVGRSESNGGCSIIKSEGLRGSGSDPMTLAPPAWTDSVVTSSSSDKGSEALLVLKLPVLLL